jgi:uncharacterized Zn finger protein (UPF0148 family)
MANCGLCGKPIYHPGKVVCDGCKKASSKAKSRNADRMNWRKDQEQELFMNMSFPGKDEEDVKQDMQYTHYVDTHDASAVWVNDDAGKGKRRRKH